MPKRKKAPTCPIHFKPLPCRSCIGKLGGSVSSPKKSKANKLKARRAAMIRWRGTSAGV